MASSLISTIIVKFRWPRKHLWPRAQKTVSPRPSRKRIRIIVPTRVEMIRQRLTSLTVSAGCKAIRIRMNTTAASGRSLDGKIAVVTASTEGLVCRVLLWTYCCGPVRGFHIPIILGPYISYPDNFGGKYPGNKLIGQSPIRKWSKIDVYDQKKEQYVLFNIVLELMHKIFLQKEMFNIMFSRMSVSVQDHVLSRKKQTATDL